MSKIRPITMAKRFTDTTKWSKPFIRGLESKYKLLWFYILDECDHAGIWQVDFQIAEIKIGESFDIVSAIKIFKGQIEEIDNGQKWFISDFIEFQYGTLNPENRAHNSVINILRKNKIKGYVSPLEGAKDKDKDKDKVIKPKKIFFTESEFFDKPAFAKAIPEWSKDKLKYYYDSAVTWSNEGNKKVDWIGTVKNWASRDEKEGKIKFKSEEQVDKATLGIRKALGIS